MTLLRILNILCWAAVLIYMTPGVFDILRGRPRTGDPARLVCFTYAVVSIAFAVRWLVLPNDHEVWALLYGLSSAAALYTLYAARSYGRGPRV